MKRSISQALLLVAVIFFSLSLFAQENINKKVDVFKMREFYQRDGLPNVFHKIATQRQVRIGYFGGSITAAKDGWSGLTFSWFRLNFPKTAFYQVNASIGGTGSDLGAFRIERDLFPEKPDLIFIEFAVNDGVTPTSLNSMEGIVRKIWTAFPNTDICFVYTTAEVYCKAMVDEGKPIFAVEEHEKVAAHYGIPSINVGLQIARLYSEKKLLLSADPSENEHTIVFTKDHTHPLLESGHPLYGSVVVKCLEKMSKKTGERNHELPAPYTTNNWQGAKMIDVSKTERIGNWTKLAENYPIARQFKQVMPSIYQAKPGAVMRFKFKGKVLGIYDCIGPGTGTLEINIDGKREEIVRFDAWCAGYRAHCFFVKELEDKVHEVEIRVLDKKIDKATILMKNEIKIEDPAKYEDLDWYPGNVLIVGEFLK